MTSARHALSIMAAALTLLPSAFAADPVPDDFEKLLLPPPSAPAVLPDAGALLLERAQDELSRLALTRVALVESAELRRRREEDPEPGPGVLIYADDFESYDDGAVPRFWPERTCRVVTVDTPGNQSKVLRFTPNLPYYGHDYLDARITAVNFRLKYDFLCGPGGEVTWLVRLHGPRGHSLWSNENYYQVNFHTTEGRPLGFAVNHLWTGAGYPFADAVQPGMTIPQPSRNLAWHTAEVIMDDDRLILKLNGVRVLDGRYPVLMARTRAGVPYGFGLLARDSHTSSPASPWVFSDWYDNVEIHDLGTPVRERRWPGRFHVAAWGDDGNAGTDPAHPWRTLTKAFASLRQGDRLTIQEGVYDEDVEWLDPQPCDLPRQDAEPAEYPTEIVATFAEEVTVTGSWNFRNPGMLRMSRISFKGGGAGLRVAGDTGVSGSRLSELRFVDGAAGLHLRPAVSATILCTHALFRDSPGGLVVGGGGRTILARSVLAASPWHAEPETAFQVVHGTGIGVAPFPDGSLNCLELPDMAAASRVLTAPERERYDPKPGAPFIDQGQPLPDDMATVDAGATLAGAAPDPGAFEFHPARVSECRLAMTTVDELTGETFSVPLSVREATLNAAIAGLRPGDTLLVGPGLWTESGLTLANRRGEAYAPIRIIADPPLGAVIHGSVNFWNCTHLEIRGFRFAGYQGTKAKAVSIGLNWRDCGYTTVAECEITEYGHCGVGDEERGVTLLRNWIHHNGTTGLNHGIYWTTEGPCWVIGNTFYGNSGWGYHNHQGAYNGWQAWKHTVHHNLFIGPGGAMVTTGSFGRFHHNTVVRASNAGFWFYNAGHFGNRISNNILFESRNQVHDRDGNVVTHNLITDVATFAGANPVRGDPLFVDPEHGNYRLHPGSPALQAGINVGLDERARPTLGAYDGNEHWAPPPPIPIYVPESLRAIQRATDALQTTPDGP